MKLTKEQLEWCEEYLTPGTWKINNRGRIDVDGDVIFREFFINNDKKRYTKIPVPFGQVYSFNFHNCKDLETLEGAPQEVLGNFSVAGCNFKTLEGSPRIVKGRFSAAHNPRLDSLKGSPDEVGGQFYVHNCVSLTTLEGVPLKLGGDFTCKDCPSLNPLHQAIITDYNNKKLDWATAYKLIHRPKLAQAHALGLI